MPAMSDESPLIYSLVLHYGSEENTLQCVECLCAQDYAPHRVLVLYPGEDGTPLYEKLLKIDSERVKLISLKENLGYAAGNNLGLIYAHGEGAKYSFIINPDCFAENPKTLSTLVRIMEDNPKLGFTAPVLTIRSPNPIESAGISFSWFSGSVRHTRVVPGSMIRYRRTPNSASNSPDKETSSPDFYVTADALSGTALMIKNEVFEKVGKLNENYFMYMEDVEWCLRAAKHDLSCAIVPGVFVSHIGRASVNKVDPALPVYYSVRNHLKMLDDMGRLNFWRAFWVKTAYRIYAKYRMPDPAHAFEMFEAGIRDFKRGKFGKKE